MKSYIYKIEDKLKNIIDPESLEKINNANAILIQLFSGEEPSKIQAVLKELKELFSQSVIITSSTDGEIAGKEVLTFSTVVTISTFEKTSLKIAYTNEKNSFEAGLTLAKRLITPTTKLIIAFADGLAYNGEEFLEAIYNAEPKITIAGGLSADNAKFEQCYVGINDVLYDSGAVAVSLNSEVLSVNNFYSFGWNAIGLKHKVTKAIKNRVYTIDNISAVDFYKKYLGERVSNKLPITGIEFPLIIDNNGFKKARAVTAKHKDGSLSFAGNITKGEEIYIGIGEVKSILSNPISNMNKVSTESFFIYSCMARRRFIPDLIYQEIEPFAKIAPTSGFFTYGEFYTNARPELLNQTMTTIALSESDLPNELNFHKTPYEENNTTKALMHILSVTSQELQEKTLLQKRISNELTAKTNTLEMIQEMSNLGSWELDLQTMKISWSKTSYTIYNMDPKKEPPSYLDYLNMVLPEDRDKLLDIQKKLNDGQIHSVEIRVQRNDEKILTLIESGKLLYENDVPIKIVGTTLDITELRMQNAILIQQSKAAQMGEMINMIAHQWRQPLNAISSAVIKLNIQSEMDLLTKEEVHKTTQFIENMTQKMSQTINDFMNFTKPETQKEYTTFQEIFQDILNIIESQLKNHSIQLSLDIATKKRIFVYKKELEHIFINIITNAKDALEDVQKKNKFIKISIYPKNHKCIIKIADNGGGIDKKIIHKIFNPYFTTKDSNKGTGLGLYMSKKILQEHLNGDISVCNKDDGAEFTIILERPDEQ